MIDKKLAKSGSHLVRTQFARGHAVNIGKILNYTLFQHHSMLNIQCPPNGNTGLTLRSIFVE